MWKKRGRKKSKEQMKFCYSHLTRNIFDYCMRSFFFGLVGWDILTSYFVIQYPYFHTGPEFDKLPEELTNIWIRG